MSPQQVFHDFRRPRHNIKRVSFSLPHIPSTCLAITTALSPTTTVLRPWLSTLLHGMVWLPDCRTKWSGRIWEIKKMPVPVCSLSCHSLLIFSISVISLLSRSGFSFLTSSYSSLLHDNTRSSFFQRLVLSARVASYRPLDLW